MILSNLNYFNKPNLAPIHITHKPSCRINHLTKPRFIIKSDVPTIFNLKFMIVKPFTSLTIINNWNGGRAMM